MLEYLTYFSRILRLIETGFVSEWKKWYVPTPSNCMEINKRVKKPKLSIKHLSGAFVILSIGCFLSTVVFVLENIRGLYAKWLIFSQLIKTVFYLFVLVILQHYLGFIIITLSAYYNFFYLITRNHNTHVANHGRTTIPSIQDFGVGTQKCFFRKFYVKFAHFAV